MPRSTRTRTSRRDEGVEADRHPRGREVDDLDPRIDGADDDRARSRAARRGCASTSARSIVAVKLEEVIRRPVGPDGEVADGGDVLEAAEDERLLAAG